MLIALAVLDTLQKVKGILQLEDIVYFELQCCNRVGESNNPDILYILFRKIPISRKS